MEVDHLLPECLLDNRDTLTEVLTEFGLPLDFNLNSFENWLPAHRHCNLQKLNHIFRATPLIQLWIDRARRKAALARERRDQSAGDRSIDRAIGILAAGNTLPLELLDPIVQYYAAANAEVVTSGYVAPSHVRLAPNLTITFDREPRSRPTVFTYTVDSAGDVRIDPAGADDPSDTSGNE
jgi:hypothetical protein